MKASTYKNNLITLGSLLLLVVSWALAAKQAGKEIILPGPLVTFQHLRGLLSAASFWHHLSATLLRGLTGFGLSYLIGLIVGIFPALTLTLKPFSAVVNRDP